MSSQDFKPTNPDTRNSAVGANTPATGPASSSDSSSEPVFGLPSSAAASHNSRGDSMPILTGVDGRGAASRGSPSEPHLLPSEKKTLKDDATLPPGFDELHNRKTVDGVVPNLKSTQSPGKPQAPRLSETDILNRQNLLNDPHLRATGRMMFQRAACPVLGGIPILKKLGEGGMGAVYLGWHMRLNVEVAVKVLPEGKARKDRTAIKRFYQEGHLAAVVSSQHIVHVMDVAEEGGTFFLVMEYVHGCSAFEYLRDIVKKNEKGYSEANVVQLAIATAQGLLAAHSKGIVHRDIKPPNIMIPYKLGNPEELDFTHAKLMDLGLSKTSKIKRETTEELTFEDQILGTPGFMPPEQILDPKSTDARADVYAMGATMYTLLTAQPLFDGKKSTEILAKTISLEHIPLRSIRPDVSRGLSTLIEQCLSKDREKRFKDAEDLLSSLREAHKPSRGTMVMLPPAPAPAPPPPPPKKSNAGLFAGLAAAVAVIGVLAFNFWPQEQHQNYLSLAAKSLSRNDVEDADKQLNRAKRERGATQRAAADQQKMAQAERELEQRITDTKADIRIKYEKKLADFDVAIQTENEPQAVQLMRDLKAFNQYTVSGIRSRETLERSLLDLQQARSNRYEDLLQRAKKLVDNDDFAAAEPLLRNAEALKPEDAQWKKAREALENKKSKTAFDALIKRATMLIRGNGNLEEAETLLATADGKVANSAAVAHLREDIERERSRRTQAARLKRSALLLLESGGNLCALEKDLTDAELEYKSDLDFKDIRASLAPLRAKLDSLLSAVETGIQLEVDLENIEARLEDASRLCPTDDRIDAAKKNLQRLAIRRDTMFDSITKTIRERKSLHNAEKTLETLTAMYPRDKRIETSRTQIRRLKQEFDGFINTGLETVKAKANVGPADDCLTQAEQLYPLDPRVALLRNGIEELRKNFDTLLASAEEGLKKENDIKKVDAELAAATAIYPNDARIPPMREKTDKLQAKFGAQLRDGEQCVKTQSGFNRVERTLPVLKNAYPNDPRVVAIEREVIAARAKLKTLLDEIESDVKASRNLIVMQTKLAEARKMFAEDERVNALSLRLDVAKANLSNLRSSIRAMLGKIAFDEALIKIKELEESNPDDPETRDLRKRYTDQRVSFECQEAEKLLQRDKITEAREHLRRAEEIDSSNAKIRQIYDRYSAKLK